MTDQKNYLTTENDATPLTILARKIAGVLFLNAVVGIIGLPFVLLFDTNMPTWGRWTLAYLLGVIVYLTFVAANLYGFARLTRQAKKIPERIAIRFPPEHVRTASIIVMIAGLLILLGIAADTISIQPPIALAGVVLVWVGQAGTLIGNMYLPSVLRKVPWVRQIVVAVGLIAILLVSLEISLSVIDAVFNQDETVAGPDTAFLADQSIPWAEQYWAEFDESRVLQWTPYVYWRREPYDGTLINVDESGVRVTYQPDQPLDSRLFVFGGSTVWGTGARDDYTIPSYLAQELNVQVTNYGESGYISRQDAILFSLRLEHGDIPDIAVFYWGYNDVFAAWQSGYAGIPQNEFNRATEFRGVECELNEGLAFNLMLYSTAIGKRLFSWAQLPVPDPSMACASSPDELDANTLSLVGYPSTTGEQFAEYLEGIMQHITQIAEPYGVQIFFVWQPGIFWKHPLTEHEQWGASLVQDFEPFYYEVDGAVRQRLRDRQDFLILTDLFEGYSETIFIDNAHITEEGNRIVSEAIVRYIRENGLLP